MKHCTRVASNISTGTSQVVVSMVVVVQNFLLPMQSMDSTLLGPQASCVHTRPHLILGKKGSTPSRNAVKRSSAGKWKIVRILFPPLDSRGLIHDYYLCLLGIRDLFKLSN